MYIDATQTGARHIRVGENRKLKWRRVQPRTLWVGTPVTFSLQIEGSVLVQTFCTRQKKRVDNGLYYSFTVLVVDDVELKGMPPEETSATIDSPDH